MEDELIDLCRYGKPRISLMSNGWLCTVDMHVASNGTSFEIKSDYDCKKPSEAIRQTKERIIETLKMYESASLKIGVDK